MEYGLPGYLSKPAFQPVTLAATTLEQAPRKERLFTAYHPPPIRTLAQPSRVRFFVPVADHRAACCGVAPAHRARPAPDSYLFGPPPGR